MTRFKVSDEAVEAFQAARNAMRRSATPSSDEEEIAAAIAAALPVMFEKVGFARTKTLDEINTPPFYGSDVYISVAEQTIWPSVPVYRIKEPK